MINYIKKKQGLCLADTRYTRIIFIKKTCLSNTVLLIHFRICSALLLWKGLGLLPIKMRDKPSLTPTAVASNFKTLLYFHPQLLIYVWIAAILYGIWKRHSRRFGKYSCIFSVTPLYIVNLPLTPTKSTDNNRSLLLLASESFPL